VKEAIQQLMKAVLVHYPDSDFAKALFAASGFYSIDLVDQTEGPQPNIRASRKNGQPLSFYSKQEIVLLGIDD
jgi:hypothetical protein